jgi:putative hydrolase of the HAD superfamily
MKKAFIFDLDDTLYREKDFVYEGFREVCKHLSKKYNLKEEKLFKTTIEVLETQGRGKIFNILCEKYNIKEDIKKLVNIYRNVKPKIELYEDAKYILDKFKNKFKLGIITDGKSSVQWNKIKALNLNKMVDKIIVSDDYGKEYWKPNQHVFLEMARYFNIDPKQCVYIGDNPNKDFIGAKKIGFKTIRIIREEGEHMKTFLDKEYEAHYNIKKLVELEEIFKE